MENIAYIIVLIACTISIVWHGYEIVNMIKRKKKFHSRKELIKVGKPIEDRFKEIHDKLDQINDSITINVDTIDGIYDLLRTQESKFPANGIIISSDVLWNIARLGATGNDEEAKNLLINTICKDIAMEEIPDDIMKQIKIDSEKSE